MLSMLIRFIPRIYCTSSDDDISNIIFAPDQMCLVSAPLTVLLVLRPSPLYAYSDFVLPMLVFIN